MDLDDRIDNMPIEESVEAAAAARFTIELNPQPLSQVGQWWPSERLTPRVVFTTGSS